MILTIIRGLPGSGKSRFAHTLSEKSGAILIEPDMFLTQNTFYLYDKDRYFTARILARQIMATILENQASDMIYADVLPKPEDVHKLIAYVAGGGCLPYQIFCGRHAADYAGRKHRAQPAQRPAGGH